MAQLHLEINEDFNLMVEYDVEETLRLHRVMLIPVDPDFQVMSWDGKGLVNELLNREFGYQEFSKRTLGQPPQPEGRVWIIKDGRPEVKHAPKEAGE